MSDLCTRCRAHPCIEGQRRCESCREYAVSRQQQYRGSDRIPKLRPTKGPIVLTEQKRACLRWIHAGGVATLRTAWIVRVLFADGLIQERPTDLADLALITGIPHEVGDRAERRSTDQADVAKQSSAREVAGIMMLTMNGLVALERGRIGALATL